MSFCSEILQISPLFTFWQKRLQFNVPLITNDLKKDGCVWMNMNYNFNKEKTSEFHQGNSHKTPKIWALIIILNWYNVCFYRRLRFNVKFYRLELAKAWNVFSVFTLKENLLEIFSSQRKHTECLYLMTSTGWNVDRRYQVAKIFENTFQQHTIMHPIAQEQHPVFAFILETLFSNW